MEEWEEQKRSFTDKINELKKDIKNLTNKLKFLHNPTKKNQKNVQQEYAMKKKPLPKGAKTIDEGIQIIDLQTIDLKKQIDVIQARFLKRRQVFENLVEEYQRLLTYKNEKTVSNSQPPETVEEDHNRKVSIQSRTGESRRISNP